MESSKAAKVNVTNSAMSSSLLDFVHQEIIGILGEDTPMTYSQYVLGIEDDDALKEYLTDLLGTTVRTSKIDSLIMNLRRRKNKLQENFTVYRKNSEIEIENQKSVKPKKKKEQRKYVPVPENTEPEIKTPIDSGRKVKESPKKKTHYVSLYSSEGEARNAVLLPGRHPCECQAQKHRLINNCLGCGRVVCEQEASGPCLFCGKIVCTPEEKKIIDRESRKSEKLMKKFATMAGGGSLASTDKDENKGLQNAKEYKDRLLEYDRSYTQRTRVIDDESDYFAADKDVWLNPKERELLKKKQKEMREMRFGSRLSKKITLDFAGRRAIEENGSMLAEEDEDILASIRAQDKPSVNPFLQENFPDLHMPKLVAKEKEKSVNGMENNSPNEGRKQVVRRLQDKEMQTMSDTGMCLSMHQPWASLLVHGIKRHEGRTWYSNHRGRLWIASASYKPTSEEIESVTDQHRQFINKDVKFPEEYPTSCLLGCVNVQDVLSQDEYRNRYPQGESASPYVFVCSDFEELLIKLPVSGKHKIWKLPTQLHNTVKKGRTTQHSQF